MDTSTSRALTDELLRADARDLRRAIDRADPMVLRGVLFQLTGDRGLTRGRIEKRPVGAMEAAFLADPDDERRVRDLAVDLLLDLRDRGGTVQIGPEDRLLESMALTAGDPIDPSELEVWTEELALDPWCRSLAWRRPPAAETLSDVSVLVIGAGIGGINAAVQLKRAGFSFQVVEKNAGIGGTWWENRYPGARVDTSNRSYSYVYAVDYPLSSPYGTQAENERYLNWVVDEFGVRDDIELETEVLDLDWVEDQARWKATVRRADGTQETRYATFVISAVGFLARPSSPAIEGADLFEGRAFHSARWPDDLDVTGQRVAVIGSGCTGYQLDAELAGKVGHLHVFQRTAQWLFERPGYLAEYPDEVKWLSRNVPFYNNFMRFRTSWMAGPHVQSRAFFRDPDWHDPDSLSEANHRTRQQRIEFLRSKLGSRPDLLEKMIPPHPPLTARPVAVDADFSIADALLRDDVTLVTEGIDTFTPRGIRTRDGVEHEVDVVVYATGFKANDFLWPMTIRGRDGRTVEDLWSIDGARAWTGVMLPGFPNLFMLYGPNTNPLSLGAVTYSELMTRFALERMEDVIEQGAASVEVTREAYDRYNRALDAQESRRTWSYEKSTSYFLNSHGRSATNFPFEGTDLWRWLRHPDPEALEVR